MKRKQVRLFNYKEFIIACIVLALEYIHNRNEPILHRDIKP